MDYKNYMLFGLIAFAMIVTGISKPASDDRATVNDETQKSDQVDEYDYDSQPADQIKSTASSPKSTLQPYFEAKTVRRTVKLGGNINLYCPVKNWSETNVLLWFKEENTITNNKMVLDNAYEVSKDTFTLIIKNATESFAGNYFCEVAPQNIRMQTILKVSNETTPSVQTPPEVPQVKEAATAAKSANSTAADNLTQSSLLSIVLVSTLMSANLLSHRKCF